MGVFVQGRRPVSLAAAPSPIKEEGAIRANGFQIVDRKTVFQAEGVLAQWLMTIHVLNSAGGRGTQPVTARSPRRVGYSVRVLKPKPRSVVRLAPETERTFRAISDLANAHLFTAEAALAALANVTV